MPEHSDRLAEPGYDLLADLVDELIDEADAIGIGSGAPTARLLRRAAGHVARLSRLLASTCEAVDELRSQVDDLTDENNRLIAVGFHRERWNGKACPCDLGEECPL